MFHNSLPLLGGLTRTFEAGPRPGVEPTGRRRMVACVVEAGWSVEATAEWFQVEAKTVLASRPRRSPNQTRPAIQRRVVAPRRPVGALPTLAMSSTWCADRASDPERAGLGRLDRGDRATNVESMHHYQLDWPVAQRSGRPADTHLPAVRSRRDGFERRRSGSARPYPSVLASAST